MQPHKTELARVALQSHAGPLGMRERRALILCDGRRDLKELTTLLGSDALALITHLHDTGYLATNAPARPASRAPAPAPAPVPAPVLTPQTEAAGTRRSLVAAKLYMIDMLELQRDESAIAHRKQLQACQDQDAIVAHLLASVHCLQRIASASLAQRVRERLTEVLPEPYLLALDGASANVPESFAA